jgi:antitoxin component YwqK of YwqJK toxin-antitoxin module
VYYYTNDLCLDGPAVNRSVSKIKQISNYKKNMLTGPSIFFYESGKIKTRRFYVNNKKSGYYREYFENGNLKMILRFNKKGEKTGNLKIFYENGSLQLSQDFSHDKRHGNFRKYFANGRIKQYKYYQNGMLNGYVKNFNKDNLITFLGVYKQNEPNGYFKKFSYVDGDIFVREMFYIDGIKQGTQIETKNGIVQNIYRYSWSGVLHGIQSLNVDEKIKHSYYEYGRLLLDGNETKQDCCVCYESTNFTTTCNHPLCCKCIQKTMKKCPMCRKNFFS